MGNLFAHTVARKAHKEGIIDLGMGFRLFRDRQTPVGMKATAVSLGALITALLVMIEAPIETIAGLLLPPAIALDFMIDGAEIIVLPVLIAAAVLPHLKRRGVRVRG